MPGKLNQSLFLLLPPELRLQIYSYILDIPSPYTDLTHSPKPLIVINDTGNKFTSRAIYRSLHISPNWVGVNDSDSDSESESESEGANEARGKGKVLTTGKAQANFSRKTLSLLSVNRQIHAEVEHFLYTSHTLFFLNGFDLDSLGAFLDTLSPTARACIRSIGFEVFLFVHNASGGSVPPKRSFAQYKRAAEAVRAKLPRLSHVVFYLDPWYAVACDGVYASGSWCDETSVLERGVGFLLRAFGEERGVGVKGRSVEEGVVDLDFMPESMKLPPAALKKPNPRTVAGTGTNNYLVSAR
ncbi:uncharacterized protein BDV14DRAFT_64586 [Aspergillus stella-maris]|uniref:uncharacterized protein n=1 Tax=Aspergillus stella-maris TaxID=1810926 RepID=UPI003CCCB582